MGLFLMMAGSIASLAKNAKTAVAAPPLMHTGLGSRLVKVVSHVGGLVAPFGGKFFYSKRLIVRHRLLLLWEAAPTGRYADAVATTCASSCSRFDCER